MHSELDALAALVAPPDEVPELDDDAVQALGFALPADHLALLRRYGPGVFVPDLGLYVPGGAPEGGFDLADIVETYAEIHEVRAAAGEGPLPMWPDPGGLLPFADDGDDGALHFLTEGPPEHWRVVLVEYEGFTLTPLVGSSTAVLLALHRGTLSPPQLAGGALAAHRRFVAATELDDDY